MKTQTKISKQLTADTYIRNRLKIALGIWVKKFTRKIWRPYTYLQWPIYPLWVDHMARKNNRTGGLIMTNNVILYSKQHIM